MLYFLVVQKLKTNVMLALPLVSKVNLLSVSARMFVRGVSAPWDIRDTTVTQKLVGYQVCATSLLTGDLLCSQDDLLHGFSIVTFFA